MAERSRSFRKSPPALIARFAAATGGNPRLTPRRMFGYPAVFAGGSLCAGLHEDKLIVRLSETDRAAVACSGAVAWQPTPGRTMREYVALPDSIVADAAALRHWLGRAIGFTESKAATARAPARRAKPGAAAAKASTRRRRKPS